MWLIWKRIPKWIGYSQHQGLLVRRFQWAKSWIIEFHFLSNSHWSKNWSTCKDFFIISDDSSVDANEQKKMSPLNTIGFFIGCKKLNGINRLVKVKSNSIRAKNNQPNKKIEDKNTNKISRTHIQFQLCSKTNFHHRCSLQKNYEKIYNSILSIIVLIFSLSVVRKKCQPPPINISYFLLWFKIMFVRTKNFAKEYCLSKCQKKRKMTYCRAKVSEGENDSRLGENVGNLANSLSPSTLSFFFNLNLLTNLVEFTIEFSISLCDLNKNSMNLFW